MYWSCKVRKVSFRCRHFGGPTPAPQLRRCRLSASHFGTGRFGAGYFSAGDFGARWKVEYVFQVSHAFFKLTTNGPPRIP
uniref:Uncharacterized protein n=1 Tax=Romanomermis culicivorax TaxID=13658 RepID=A0A915J4A9_ROMCU